MFVIVTVQRTVTGQHSGAKLSAHPAGTSAHPASACKICLCIVFNHAFPANIEVLERIYRHRFAAIRYIMPFHRDRDNADLITVYRGSYQHEGFVTDAYGELKDVDCTHFIFMQDDVLLNPAYDERNLAERLKLGPGSGFITQVGPLTRDIASWHWLPGILWRLFYPRNLLSGSGVDSLQEILRHLPSVDQARKVMSAYGISDPVITGSANSLKDPSSVFHNIPHFGTTDSHLVEPLNELVVNSLFSTAPSDGEITIPYPFALTAWGADFFVVPKTSLHSYQHYCGVMAGASIFAEIAVGTALLLTVERVETANSVGGKFEWDWSESRADNGLALLEHLQDPDMIAVHPVKLSALAKDTSAIERIIAASASAATPLKS